MEFKWSAAYNARKEINGIRTCNNYEFSNIIDRLFINIFNDFRNEGLLKAREECKEKKINNRVMDQVEKIINTPRGILLINEIKSNDILALSSFLSKKFPNISSETIDNCSY